VGRGAFWRFPQWHSTWRLWVPGRGARGSTRDTPVEPALILAEAVGLLRSGAAPATAWAAVGIRDVDHRGVPVLVDADPAWDAVRAACSLAHTAGSGLADVLEVVADHIQLEREARAARESAIAGPRLSATVLQWLPAMGLGLGALIDVHALKVLFVTALGWVLLTSAGVLVWAGRWWMGWLVRGAEEASQVVSTGPGGVRDRLPVTLLLTLVDAALASGLDVRGAVAVVGEAIGRAEGHALEHVSSALALGEPWAGAWSGCPAPLLILERALRSAWTAGTSPRALLRATSSSLRLEARLAAEKAVGELGVRMALPLTLCMLPAFALVGLVPMLVAVASSTSISW
jgi:tight adherence protein B